MEWTDRVGRTDRWAGWAGWAGTDERVGTDRRDGPAQPKISFSVAETMAS